MNCVKISVSLPEDLWEFVEKEKTATGRRGTSHVIQDAVDMLRRSRHRASLYRASLSKAPKK